jgi:hypothetical protein
VLEKHISSPRQGRSGSVRILQIQRVLRLMAMRPRSGTPKPPCLRGLQILSQLTWQCHPFASALPAQRKPLQIFWICFRVFLLSPSTMIWCRGIAISTDLTRAKRPTFVIMEAFHVGRRSAILSTSGWSAAANRLRTDRGMPRYLIGKGANWHSLIHAALSASSSVQAMGGHRALSKVGS